MDFFSFGPIAAILDGAYRFVTSLAATVEPVVGATSGLVAVVILTMLVRALLVPAGRSQVRAEFTRRRLAPKIAELQKKHGKDRETLTRKTVELYATEKASPFAGFLPLLLQIPIISLVYAVFTHVRIAGHANALLAQQVLGAPLGTSFVGLAGAVGSVWPSIVVYLIVLVLIAAVTTLSRRVLAVPQPGGTAPSGFAKVLSFLPYVTVMFAAFVPLAAAVYILTSTAWTVAERYTLRRILDPARGARSRPATG